MTPAPARGRTLVVGDPIVSLGEQTLIADGALIVEGPTIVAAGPREDMEARGPFDRVLGSIGNLLVTAFVVLPLTRGSKPFAS